VDQAAAPRRRFCGGPAERQRRQVLSTDYSNVKLLLREARSRGIPVIFALDSRYPDDFIFKSGHPPRTIRGPRA